MKKKTVEQEKRISQLTASAGAGQAASPKVSELVKNLGSLQAQYDTVQDKVEEQNGKIKTLEQDLAKSIQDSVSTKEALASAQSDLRGKDSSLATAQASLKAASEELAELRPAAEAKEALEKTVADLQSRLGNLSEAERKQDMLDMELEKAEAKVTELTEAKAGLEEKLAAEIVEKSREAEARQNKDAQITELESLLQTESHRVTEFKVISSAYTK